MGSPIGRRAAATGAAALYLAVSILAAVLEVLLVPVRHGTTVVPVSVVLAAVTMLALPPLAGVAVGRTAGAVLPVVGWLLTVIALSTARPEGDVLLVGNAPLSYVSYALLGVGAICGIAAVLRFDRRRLTSGAGQTSLIELPPAVPAARPVRPARRPARKRRR